MSIDVDDVGAVCAMHALADRGEVNILAVVHNSASEQGVGALSVLNHYYGRDDVPIGAYRGRVGLPNENYQSPWGFKRLPPEPAWQVGPYVGPLVKAFPSRVRNMSQAYDATTLLRLVLAAASERSVTIVSVGYATNLLGLLESSNDHTSALTGRQLVFKKVKQLVLMGGRHMFHKNEPVEWNLAGATPQANVCNGACGEHDNLGSITNRTLAQWPREARLVYVDFETGVDIWTGEVLRNGAPESSPCRLAYEIFCKVNVGWCHKMNRCSWDIMALIFAVRGPSRFYKLEAGHNVVDPHTGRNTWTVSPSGASRSRDVATEFSIVLPRNGASRSHIVAEINELLVAPPLNG